MDGFERAAIVGAGTMGRGIARLLAGRGVAVSLCDRDEALAEAGRATLAEDVQSAVRRGELPADEAARMLARVRSAADLPAAVDGAELVVEAIPEVIEAKREVWQRLAGCVGGEAVLTTNTSSFDIDVVVGDLGAGGRALGMHWYNPAYLVPCVELVPARDTDPAVVDRVATFLRSVGKSPAVVANRAGFVGNRIQFAMIAEAFRCLGEGVASAEDIDAIVRDSFGFRLGDYGPFQVADMNGLDVYQGILEYLAGQLGERFAPPEELLGRVRAGRLGLKTGSGVYPWPAEAARAALSQRDERLRSRLRSREVAE
ncbi:3-hydroxyacyl-CoA dehydrogenase family protein [Dactylosporangium sp. NPDC000555]|uniref:3-hydroxyacyl-CoA dehydrogenase family protein n=1 Tax=Dactylosporangium sp. NPDC000555 TaxID=3154260 RepID=UPI00331D6CBA